MRGIDILSTPYLDEHTYLTPPHADHALRNPHGQPTHRVTTLILPHPMWLLHTSRHHQLRPLMLTQLPREMPLTVFFMIDVSQRVETALTSMRANTWIPSSTRPRLPRTEAACAHASISTLYDTVSGSSPASCRNQTCCERSDNAAHARWHRS